MERTARSLGGNQSTVKREIYSLQSTLYKFFRNQRPDVQLDD